MSKRLFEVELAKKQEQIENYRLTPLPDINLKEDDKNWFDEKKKKKYQQRKKKKQHRLYNFSVK